MKNKSLLIAGLMAMASAVNGNNDTSEVTNPYQGLGDTQLRKYSDCNPIWQGKSQRAKHFNKKRHGRSLRRKHSK